MKRRASAGRGPTARASLAGGALLLIGLALAAACRPSPPPVHAGPIVLITIDALRADEASAFGGTPGLMPALDALAAEADRQGPAVAPSSWTVPSMAAILTGRQPWTTRGVAGARPVLDERLTTLAESLTALGYRATAFRSNHWLQGQFGYAQGFAEFRYLAGGKRAERFLAKLDGGRQFVWVHVLQPHAPYTKRDAYLPRLKNPPPNLPSRVRPLDLEPYFDPAAGAAAEQLRIFRAMYDLNAAFADDLLGRLLSSIRASRHWDETLLVVSADHGEEFGENGQVAHGGNLGRQLVEVPLVVKLPKGFTRRIAAAPGERVGNVRIAATLIEAAGGTPEPGTAPSLFVPWSKGTLSELYLGNGVNRFSLVDGDLQLVWESRFAAEEPDYYRARLAGIGGDPKPALLEAPNAVFARLEQRFAAVLPLSGRRDEKPRLELWRWTAKGREPVEDAAIVDRMARQLRGLWVAANGPEVVPGQGGPKPQLSPEEIKQLQALGYVAAGS